jgi:hypothetical protein
VAPLLGGAEVAAVAGLEPGDAVGQQGLEFVGTFEGLVGAPRAASRSSMVGSAVSGLATSLDRSP